MIVTIQGTSSTTSQYSKTLASYTNSEILWGQRFKQCVSYDDDIQSYSIDHKQFNKTEEVLTPLCSPQQLQKVLMDVECFTTSYNINSPIIRIASNENVNYVNERMLNGDEEPIDADIYTYINDVRSKLVDNNRLQSVNSNLDVRSVNKSIVDVENLIENLQKYVDDNLKIAE